MMTSINALPALAWLTLGLISIRAEAQSPDADACSADLGRGNKILLAQAATASPSGTARSTISTQQQKVWQPPASANRTVPEVTEPKAALEFSKQPTVAEFFRARLFEEPLIPIDGTPADAENAALAAALRGYAARPTPDDFSGLDDFLAEHPTSSWRAALLINLGLEAYRTGRYSRTIDSWAEAWRLSKDATDAPARALADRAAGELASMYARLGRMTELDALLRAVESRVFTGAATERITEAREGLHMMRHDPGISFLCGPLALHRIALAADPQNARTDLVLDSKSTTNGFSLPQVAQLSAAMGLKYQMAFRSPGAAFVVPAVVHWKVGHYAAVIREEDGRFLVQDPTFRNDLWITRAALEAEASGYFVIPPGALAANWRAVDEAEGSKIWGKGKVGGPDPHHGGGKPKPKDPKPKPKPMPQPDHPCKKKGMAVADVDLLFVSLELADAPVGYEPPVGPAVSFELTYNQRESAQPANFTYSNFGPKWTFDWLSYIQDNPSNLNADVQYYRQGGFTRNFTGFNAGTQSFALQTLDFTSLTRTSAASYEMVSHDGSKLIFNQSDGSTGTSRKIFLKQIIDSHGNALTLTYDGNLRVVALTDAIGQVTTLAYQHATDIYRITKVTDPFGRFAAFEYDATNRLKKITDVIGITSEFVYTGASDFIEALITPYGTTSFIKAESGTTRSLDTIYPDGNRTRVEFNQTTTLGIPNSEPAAQVPTGMAMRNEYLWYRNTYYWDEIAYAAGAGDYTKAKIYHWLHSPNGSTAVRLLESEKKPLENRVWYDYPNQVGGPIFQGSINQPNHVGRVLDDGTTQLYTYEYNNPFGKATSMIDPVGRTTSYTYAANGQDLLEIRMTRNGANELLSKKTYNTRHQVLTNMDAAGQTTTYSYNARGQALTITNAKNEVTTNVYDANGRISSMDGPLPGPADTIQWTYDVVGRIRTITTESNYTLTFDYDNLDRLTRTTFPDATYEENVYNRLDRIRTRDRAGRETHFEYDARGQMIKNTDPLNRVTLYQWCKCGDLKTLTDALGRTTTWRHDIQGRPTAKVFADGSQITWQYENTTSRTRQQIDEKGQATRYSYAADDNITSIQYSNAAVATPSVSYTYDANYNRVASMTDGSGTTVYAYVPITLTPALGAGDVASIDGPLPNDTLTYFYDELGRCVGTSIGGDSRQATFDPAGRVIGMTNALGTFTFGYDGASGRVISAAFPNGQTIAYGYEGNTNDRRQNRITNARAGSPISEFLQTHDTSNNRIANWSQQAGTASPVSYALGYNAANELTSATGTRNAVVVKTYAYGYDAGQNRVSEQIDGGPVRAASHNALNELTAVNNNPATAATYEWDAAQRLAAVNRGTLRTEFTYDGLDRRVRIRELNNAVETSDRRFVWGDEICEERTAAGNVVKRFYPQGVKVETGPGPGKYFYTKDHLGSIRELVDEAGTVRARYAYELYGARTKVSGDLDTDFGFTGHFTHAATGLCLPLYRAYDPSLGRWLSRDPLPDAELEEGPNLYAYVANNPVGAVDPFGLEEQECCVPEYKNMKSLMRSSRDCQNLRDVGKEPVTPDGKAVCTIIWHGYLKAEKAYYACSEKPCNPPPPPPPPPSTPKKPKKPKKPDPCANYKGK